MSGAGNAGDHGERPSARATEERKASEPSPSQDVALPLGPTPDGEGVRVLRKKQASLELGELRALKEGQPIHGEVVRLRPRGEEPRLFDVEVLVPGEAKAEPAQRGPAQVATEAYRASWERIFGEKPSGALH